MAWWEFWKSFKQADTSHERQYRYQVIIQFDVTGEMGEEGDLDKRHMLEDLLGKALEIAENGICDGGDIGMGKMNIFCYADNVKNALTTILYELTKNKIENNFIIAERDLKDEKESINVIYPEKYGKEFTY